MMAIQAVYENGDFRPTEPVELTEGSLVVVEPSAVGVRQPQPTDPEFAHLDPSLREIHAILARRHEGGEPDASARHNEHQP